MSDNDLNDRYRCEECDTVHESTGWCEDEECNGRVREYLPMVGPAWFVDMPSGMPDLLFAEDEFEAAFQNATGIKTEDAHDEHEEEWRIRLMDWEGSMDVPVVHP